MCARKIAFEWSDWNSEDILRDMNPTLVMSNDATVGFKHELLNNVFAEYDSINLSNYLKEKACFSPEFYEFENNWLKDEKNHFRGLKKIYSRIFSVDERDIDDNASKRESDFSTLEEILEDEFSLCVCLAFDELASTRGYAADFDLYDSFGCPAISKWIRLAAKDEMLHSLNAIRILNSNHAHKIDKAPIVLRRILELENGTTGEYKATFLLDHESDPGNNPFNHGFLSKCASDVCKYLGLGKVSL
jgi:hypothetical protein